MPNRWIALLVAVFLAPVLAGPPANAATPGIRSTKEYRALKTYVQELDTRKDQPQTADQIAAFRSELSTRRAKAAVRIRVLYQEQLGKAKQRRDNRKAKVVALKQRRNSEIAQLTAARQTRLNAIAADQRAEIARINTTYATKQATLTKQLDKARRQLAKATDPLVQADLREEIAAIQGQLNSLSQEKRADVSIANNKYEDQAESARESFSERIDETRESFAVRIRDVQSRLRELYAQSKQNARQRRADEFALVRTKYQQGEAYIDQMPVQGPADPGQTP